MEKAWHPTPVLLPGKSDVQRSLVGLHGVHGVARSQTQLSDFTFTFHFHALEEEMIQQMLATGSLVPLPFLQPAWTSGSSWFMYCWSLAWRILSIKYLFDNGFMVSQRVRTSWLSNNNNEFSHSTNNSNSRYLKQSRDQKKKIRISFYLF